MNDYETNIKNVLASVGISTGSSYDPQYIDQTTTTQVSENAGTLETVFDMVKDKIGLASAASYISFLHFIIIILAVILVLFMVIAVIL